MSFIKIYVTFPNEKEAERIAKHLLEKKMIACVNFFPVKSMFRWEGKIQDSDEVVGFFATKKDNWDKVRTEIRKLHPYEVPAIIRLSAESTEDYEEWVEEESR